MKIRAALEQVMNSWPAARTEEFARHRLAAVIRNDAVQEVARVLTYPGGLVVKGSAGAGQWAVVPWIAVFDDVVTDSATHGYYVVYLFHASLPIVHLSLNQGATATRAEFKQNARAVLADRATLIRWRIKDFADRLPVTSIDLGSSAQLPADYAAGHAMGLTYSATELPSDEVLAQHLNTAIAAYRALTFRGGLDPTAEADDDAPVMPGSLIELRRYKMHRRIERNPRAAKEAKKHHGLRCQACNIRFDERYGELGQGFIEAHHLLPISALEEGAAVLYDIASDFAVLCSNCHRMIHRTLDPSDLRGFCQLISL
jgi:5-methylcytosine-specific restriction protein A